MFPLSIVLHGFSFINSIFLMIAKDYMGIRHLIRRGKKGCLSEKIRANQKVAYSEKTGYRSQRNTSL